MAQTYKEKGVRVDGIPHLVDLEIIANWHYVRTYMARKAYNNRSKRTKIGAVTVKVKPSKVKP